ncbi:MAG: SNF2-related protein [Thermoguttaceae bacterium]
MPLADRCCADFISQVRSRGEQYVRENRVHFQTVYDDAVAVAVSGDSGEYEVLLDWSEARKGFVEATCTCPYFEDHGLCKHIWATIRKADAQGIGPRNGKRRLSVLEGDLDDKEDEGAADFWDSDDDDDDSYEGKGAWRAATRSGPPAPGKSRQTTAWRNQLAAVFDNRDPSFSAHAGIPQAEKAREAWYVLDVTACHTAGGISIRLFQREAKMDGEFGKLKPLTIDRTGVDRFPLPEDRESLRLLLACRRDSGNGYGGYSNPYRYYGCEPKFSDVPLEADACLQVLPKLCETGRFVWLLDGSQQSLETDARPLAWDSGPPWRFHLHVAADENRKHWRLEGQLISEGEEAAVPLKTPPLLFTGALVLIENRLARMEKGDSQGWIAALRQHPSITVPYRDRWELLKRLWQLPSPPQTSLPENLRCEEVRVPPQGRLIVQPPDSFDSNRLRGDVEFQYGEEKVRARDCWTGTVDVDRRRILVRDRDKERELWDFLAAGGALAAADSHANEHDVWIPKPRFAGLVDALLRAGWTVEAEGRRIRKPGQSRLSVTSGVDWFDLEGTWEFDGISATLPELLAALRRGQTYVQLGDGSRGLLPQEWLDKFAFLANMGEAEDGHIRFRPSQAMVLDALLAVQKEVSVDEQFAHIRSKLRSFSGIARCDAPPGFSGQLRDYQKDGLGWLNFLRDFRLGGCLADDMGLGKTVQVLALLESRRARPVKNGRRAPSLVVVPRSLVFNWIEEARKFSPNLRVADYTGPLRKEIQQDLDNYDLVVTTYGTLHRDITKLKDVRFDYTILDEAQAIKNAQSQRAKTCRLLQTDHRLAVTGTPVENHLGELWSLFEFLNPGMLGSSTTFQAVSKKATQDSENVEFLRHALAPFILRRTKQQVLTELPQKTEQTLFCDLEGRQLERYRALRDYYRASLSQRIEQTGFAKAKIHVLEALLRLRQAALHPGLIDQKCLDRPSAKLEVLQEQLQEVLQEGHKALVFSQFTSFLSIVRKQLDAEKIVYEYLDGSTRDRQRRVDRFQNDPACSLFLISLKAGGHGLNLTAADYVFILDPWWNPAVEAQAVDRAHRIGQSRNVFAYRLIARNTVEEKILELQKSKRNLAEAIVSADANVLRNLTAEDLQALLS